MTTVTRREEKRIRAFITPKPIAVNTKENSLTFDGLDI